MNVLKNIAAGLALFGIGVGFSYVLMVFGMAVWYWIIGL
jgi:hypothetical protein